MVPTAFCWGVRHNARFDCALLFFADTQPGSGKEASKAREHVDRAPFLPEEYKEAHELVLLRLYGYERNRLIMHPEGIFLPLFGAGNGTETFKLSHLHAPSKKLQVSAAVVFHKAAANSANRKGMEEGPLSHAFAEVLATKLLGINGENTRQSLEWQRYVNAIPGEINALSSIETNNAGLSRKPCSRHTYRCVSPPPAKPVNKIAK